MTPATVVEHQAGPLTRNLLWRTSPSQNPRIRVGVLLDDTWIERCFASVLDDIRQSNFAQLKLAVFRSGGPSRVQTHPMGLGRRLLNAALRRRMLYDSYLRFDNRMKPQNHPLDKVDCSEVLSGIDRVEIPSTSQDLLDGVAKIRARDLDVLINLGSQVFSGEILGASRFGVWSYVYADTDAYAGEPPHFWEMREQSPISGVELKMETADEARILCKSYFTTFPTISVSRNRFAPYWGSTELVIRKLNELHRKGAEALTGTSASSASDPKHVTRGMPTNLEMARWLGPVLLRKALGYPFRKKVVQHWNIAVRVNARPLFEDPVDGNLHGFRWIDSPPGHFWADPFGFEHNDTNWLFFEDYSYSQKRAWISCAEITSDGSLSSPVVCLDNPERHYSYPYIFRDRDEIYMIPEAYDSESVDLYRCDRFPDKWSRITTIFKGKFVDTSVWYDQGLWWLLTTSADPNPRTSCLFLFYAEALTGKWRFHPSNPISTDVRNNRGAGRIFRKGARWIRPSQSCCPVYGYSFSLNEVSELSTERYSERTLRTVTPEFWKGLSAVHTYNWVRNVELIDGASMVPLKRVSPRAPDS